MALRLVQGLLIPAMLTSLMTYISQVTAKSDIARAMAWYIAATILGGFAGRAFSGLIASLLHWRFSFLFLGLPCLSPGSGWAELLMPVLCGLHARI